MTQQACKTSQSGHKSIKQLVGVLAEIIILGAIVVMIGRLCLGRRIMGHGQYDFEGWLEDKCGSNIDGRVEPPPHPRESFNGDTAPAGSSGIGSGSEEGRNKPTLPE